MTHILLDETDTRVRRLQWLVMAMTIAAMSLVPLQIAGFLTPVPAGFAPLMVGLSIVIGPKVRQRWQVAYRGHDIRLENDMFSGERLFIDGSVAAKGGFGRRLRLEARIQRGDGVGDCVVAECHAGLTKFRCRLIVEQSEGVPA